MKGVYDRGAWSGRRMYVYWCWLVRVCFGVSGLAAVCCVGGLGGAGLLCFLNLLRLRSRSCRSCCSRRYCGVLVLRGGVVSLAVSCGGRLLFALCSSERDGGCCRLLQPRHCCGVKSCRCAHLCFSFGFGLVIVVVVVGVTVWVVLMGVSFAVGDVGEGGMHDSDHNSLSGVLTHEPIR